MSIVLRRGISFCEASGRLVFLDVFADRYFALEPAAERAFRGLIGSGAPGIIEGELAQLIQRGLLEDSPVAQPPRPCTPPSPAHLSLLDQELARVSMASVLGAAQAVLRARLELRVRGLAALLRQLSQRKHALRCDGPQASRLDEVAAAFERSNRLIRSHDQCLVRSVGLASSLAGKGIPADLVIGVRVRPFAAHCWVQSGPWLVNDRHDRVRAYAPILVL